MTGQRPKIPKYCLKGLFLALKSQLNQRTVTFGILNVAGGWGWGGVTDLGLCPKHVFLLLLLWIMIDQIGHRYCHLFSS